MNDISLNSLFVKKSVFLPPKKSVLPEKRSPLPIFTEDNPLDPYTIYRCGDMRKFGAEIKLLEMPKRRVGRKNKRSERLDWEKILEQPLKKVNRKAKSVVYLIRNKLEFNDREEPQFYIGKTKGELGKRMRNHFYSALRGRGCTNLARAIREYGITAFRVSILYQGPHIHTKEHELIAAYHATNVNIGYNIAK